MKSIAFIFKSSPYGTSASHECLNAVLSFSMINYNIGIFFIDDGILNILENQKPKKIFSSDFIKTFSVLPLYGVKEYYICTDSLKKRNLFKKDFFIFNNKIFKKLFFFKTREIIKKLNKFNYILTF